MRMPSWYCLVWTRKCLTSLKWGSYTSVSGEDSFLSALCTLHFFICKEKETYLSVTGFLPFENKSQNRVFQTMTSSRAAAAASAFPHLSRKACTVQATVGTGWKRAAQQAAGVMCSSQEGAFSTRASQWRNFNLSSLQNQVWWRRPLICSYSVFSWAIED